MNISKQTIYDSKWTDEKLFQASQKLTSLNLIFDLGDFQINLHWFRVMFQRKEEWMIYRHKHSSYEFHLVAQGGSMVTTDDGVFIVKEGQFFITPPCVYHSQQNLLNKGYVEYCLNCSIEESKETINLTEEFNLVNILKQVKSCAYNDTNDVIGLFELALKESMEEQIGYYNVIKSIVIKIFIESARIINKKSHIAYHTPHKVKKNDERFKTIEQYIKNNISNIKTTKDVAKYLYLSEKQICRIVKEKKGLSTKQLICKIKLEKAKELLKETNYSIKDIADMLGFSSQFYFNEFFKRYETFPPSSYRKNLKIF